MTFYLNPGYTQKEFDKSLNELQEYVMTGGEGQIQETNPEQPAFPSLLVEGYWDIDVDDSDVYSYPQFWYNKQELDKRGIKYGLNN